MYPSETDRRKAKKSAGYNGTKSSKQIAMSPGWGKGCIQKSTKSPTKSNSQASQHSKQVHNKSTKVEQTRINKKAKNKH